MKKYHKKTATSKRTVAEKRIKITDDLLWGVHPVFEALSQEPERINEIVVQKGRKGGKIEELIELARKEKIKIDFVNSFTLTGPDAGQARHQGVVARTLQTALLPFEDMLAFFKQQVEQGQNPRLVVCDSLQDPHNLGAVVRSALASGMDGVLVTRERSAPLGGTAAKSAAGAMSHIAISQVTNLASALKQLKKAGAWIYGAVKDHDAVSLYDTDLTGPACVVVGSEGQGIRPLIKKECDVILSIPMSGTLDSLNSSVAAAVIMFEMMRQRQK